MRRKAEKSRDRFRQPRSRVEPRDGSEWRLDLGANKRPDGSVSFRVWAPRCKEVAVQVLTSERPGPVKMQKDDQGYFSVLIEGLPDGVNYYYLLDGERKRPDPVSRFQRDGVHGPTEVVKSNTYRWKDSGWKGLRAERAIFYELHIGTFTREGTFDAAVKKLPYLKKLGITCVEVMPVAQFPGTRNWGYDGVSLFAVQNSYGGPAGLKKFVDACHGQGIAVCLDVVYNHFGPEGNYLHDYGPYFTRFYPTPWGDALNFDGEDSDPVRHFVVSNAVYWISEYHVDALRLDAVHSIFDHSARHILQEIKEAVAAQAARLRKKIMVIAESDLNDPKIIRPQERGGYALDAQWSDDFHHSLHVSLTGEKQGYYEDFKGLPDLAKAIEKSFVYDGQYSTYRKRRHGASAEGLSGSRFVQYSQNHDQVGNRAWGDRLNMQISFEAQKLAAGLVLLLPHVPLLWMGQEYGERAPFQYFVSHGDPELLESVREGRKREFEKFGWSDIPDPSAEETFEHSKLNWSLIDEDRHAFLLKTYQDLIRLRRKLKLLTRLNKRDTRVFFDVRDQWLAIEYTGAEYERHGILASFSEGERVVKLPFRGRKMIELLNTEDEKYGGFLARTQKREYHREALLNAVGLICGRMLK